MKVLIRCVSVFLVMLLWYNPLLAANIDPRILDIVQSLQHQRELLNTVTVQGKGTKVWRRAWSQIADDGTVKTDVGFSTREMDIFFARSGDKFRCDLTTKFPDLKDPQITKHIVKPGKEIEGFGFEVANPRAIIRELTEPSLSRVGDIQMLLSSSYSILAQPLTEQLQSEYATFQIVGEETCNGSRYLVLHGRITEAGLQKSQLPLTNVNDVTIDIWLDLQKNFSIVQWKYRIEGFM